MSGTSNPLMVFKEIWASDNLSTVEFVKLPSKETTVSISDGLMCTSCAQGTGRVPLRNPLFVSALVETWGGLNAEKGAWCNGQN